MPQGGAGAGTGDEGCGAEVGGGAPGREGIIEGMGGDHITCRQVEVCGGTGAAGVDREEQLAIGLGLVDIEAGAGGQVDGIGPEGGAGRSGQDQVAAFEGEGTGGGQAALEAEGSVAGIEAEGLGLAAVNASDRHIVSRGETSPLEAEAVGHQGASHSRGGAVAKVEGAGGDEPQIDGVSGGGSCGGLDVAGDAGSSRAGGVDGDATALDAVEGHGGREPEVGGVAGGHTSGDRLGGIHGLIDQPRC